MRTEIKLWRDFARDGFGVYIIERNHEGRISAVAKDIIMETVEEGFYEVPYSFFIPEEHAQIMANQLWEQGIRPDNVTDSGGELRATKFHLEDMRKLAKVDK